MKENIKASLSHQKVLLTSFEEVLSPLPYTLLAEAQILRNRAKSLYQSSHLFESTHMLNKRRNGLGLFWWLVIDTLKIKEIKGDPLLDASAFKALIGLL
ncbi:E3 ubiquitin-protein ligase UPL1-like [Vicia villosa]|uniref:E3 ubiquitin-protein ligase UPL1-like n=1 Tax=Vicia villosa TaxID=3911 RepID=UPI00273C302C|nr:E3 ubiquitin-protein ligase UPL1-like [Vicia villosa]